MKNLILVLLLVITNSCKSQNDKTIEVIDIETVKTEVIGKEVQLVDVRTPDEYEAGHIDDAINIDIMNMETFTEKLDEFDKEKPIYIYCKLGGRSNKASKVLEELGFVTIYDFSGGYDEWKSQ
ncbi:Rhodanese-like domain protein [hydrothermal vent metagenome]|uniref:Rhodanese-like domain protein n=1 Tax=hydrothermal vent metagenome TaxID=652676 RepID=A0A3B0T5Q7_9ZZZZ